MGQLLRPALLRAGRNSLVVSFASSLVYGRERSEAYPYEVPHTHYYPVWSEPSHRNFVRNKTESGAPKTIRKWENDGVSTSVDMSLPICANGWSLHQSQKVSSPWPRAQHQQQLVQALAQTSPTL